MTAMSDHPPHPAIEPCPGHSAVPPVASPASSEVTRVGPLRRDQLRALRMHRAQVAQEQRQVEAILAGTQARWWDLVCGAAEAHGLEVDPDKIEARDVVVDGATYYEIRNTKESTE